MQRKTVVIFFHARHYLPLRATNEAHLRCWGRYSKHRVVYVNVGFGVPWYLLRHLDIDAIVFDTIFLSMHWSPEYFRKRSALCVPIKALNCVKIAIPQDEFIHIDLVVEFLDSIGVTHILTCSDEADWPKVYGKLNQAHVNLRTVLTGYVDETRLSNLPKVPLSDRHIDLGYRAWRNPYWLGEHGMQKVKIGKALGEAARKRGLNVDINNPAATDFLIGSQWYEFLSRCRAVVGVEGGASVLDRDGSIMQRTEEYVTEHPNASFEETRDHCFPGQDHQINLACLSPRHFEACMTRTCQVLLEGHYNGVFKPWIHYIPVKKDYSNVEEVIDAIQDDKLVEKIVDQAYEDIVVSGKWGYCAFVREIEETIIDQAVTQHYRGRAKNQLFYLLLRMRAAVIWKFAHLEAAKQYKMIRRTAKYTLLPLMHIVTILKRAILRVCHPLFRTDG